MARVARVRAVEGERDLHMRVLVTGALGHIGSRLIRTPSLLERAEEIVLVDDLSTCRFPSLFDLPEGGRYRFVEGAAIDVVTERMMMPMDAVVHLAANSNPSEVALVGERETQQTIATTKHILEVALATGTKFLFPSSTSVYRPAEDAVNEESPIGGTLGPYSRCKLEEESLIASYVQSGLDGTVLRLGSIFGVSPGMRFHTAINRFCWMAATGRGIQVWRTALDQVRPYLDVADAAAAFAHFITESEPTSKPVNVVTWNGTVREILQEVRNTGVAVDYELVDDRLMSTGSLRVSTARAETLGFRPDGSLHKGVAETLKLFQGLLPTRT